jgi:hypothetical protein
MLGNEDGTVGSHPSMPLSWRPGRTHTTGVEASGVLLEGKPRPNLEDSGYSSRSNVMNIKVTQDVEMDMGRDTKFQAYLSPPL